jgi:hypothetical protein
MGFLSLGASASQGADEIGPAANARCACEWRQAQTAPGARADAFTWAGSDRGGHRGPNLGGYDPEAPVEVYVLLTGEWGTNE